MRHPIATGGKITYYGPGSWGARKGKLLLKQNWSTAAGMQVNASTARGARLWEIEARAASDERAGLGSEAVVWGHYSRE